jgi:hypothetical protein
MAFIAKMIRQVKENQAKKNPDDQRLKKELETPATVFVKSKFGPVTEVSMERWQEIQNLYPDTFQVVDKQ